MNKILHISADFPDQLNSNSTNAVKNLIDGTKDWDHIIFSLNRVFHKKREVTIKSGKIISINFWGFPFGLFLKWFMLRLAKKILNIIEDNNIRIDVIHAHKLTYEGIVARYLSKKTGIPFILSIRGDTDIKVLSYKLFYRKYYKELIEFSSHLFLLSPWVLDKMKKIIKFDIDSIGVSLLPNIVSSSEKKLLYCLNSNKFITICDLDEYKRKNIKKLIKAFNVVIDKYKSIELDIIGGGYCKNVYKIERYINRLKNRDSFHYLGKINNIDLMKRLPQYAAMLLPSKRETFGMVYIEALFAGIPILYSKNTGVDGYFDNKRVGIKVNPYSIKDIIKGIEKLFEVQNEYKKNILSMLNDDSFNLFRKENIVKHYRKIILTIK